MNRRRILVIGSLLAVLVLLAIGATQGLAASSMMGGGGKGGMRVKTEADLLKYRLMRPTKAQRLAAAARMAAIRANPVNKLLNGLKGLFVQPKALNPLGLPDYFGTIPNYANTQLPMDSGGNFATTTATIVPGTGVRKFVDTLPGLGAGDANDLGQYIPVAVPDTTTYPGSDYYVIALVRYTEKLHADLPPTTLQGYVQMNNAGTVQLVAAQLPRSDDRGDKGPAGARQVHQQAADRRGRQPLPPRRHDDHGRRHGSERRRVHPEPRHAAPPRRRDPVDQ